MRAGIYLCMLDMPKDELIRKINDLEKNREIMYSEREKMKHDYEKEISDMERRLYDSKGKSESEVVVLKKILKDKQDIIEHQSIKIRDVCVVCA